MQYYAFERFISYSVLSLNTYNIMFCILDKNRVCIVSFKQSIPLRNLKYRIKNLLKISFVVADVTARKLSNLQITCFCRLCFSSLRVLLKGAFVKCSSVRQTNSNSSDNLFNVSVSNSCQSCAVRSLLSRQELLLLFICSFKMSSKLRVVKSRQIHKKRAEKLCRISSRLQKLEKIQGVPCKISSHYQLNEKCYKLQVMCKRTPCSIYTRFTTFARLTSSVGFLHFF